MIHSSTPKIFRVETEADLERIPFEDGMAAVEIPAHLLDHLELKHAERGDSPRLQNLLKSIRSKGFQPVEPVTARIGRRGRWIVINGGHRITAARRIMAEFWPNLFGNKVKSLYFILFTNAESWSKTHLPDGVDKAQLKRSDVSESQEAWERAGQRNQLSAPAAPPKS